MKEPTYVITYDVGTTGVKTCLFEIGEVVRLTAAAMRGYELYVLPDGGAEQEPAEWWEAMCASTREVLDASGMDPTRISGVSFCSQMQGVVLVDKDGEPVRRAMSYMDQRAREELKKGLAHGPQIAGANVFKLLKSLQITGAVAASVKDPVWKYKWVQAHEPENFKRVHKWLDVKEFLICKMTGEFVMTQDSAFAALIYDIRKGKEGWSREMCDMLGVNMNHLAPIKQSTDKVGEITEKAASELGLKAGTAVFGGTMVAPVASQIMSEILPLLGVEPDYTAEELVGADTTVPNVVGQTREAAEDRLADLGFTFRTVGDGDTVTDQTPAGGAIVPGNASIILYLGQEKPDTPCTVPNVVGKSASEANKAITNAGLIMKVTGTTTASSGNVYAITQSLPAGTEVAAGTVVTVQFGDNSVLD